MNKGECPGCDLPVRASWFVKWGDNGTIVVRVNPVTRVALVESDLLNDIYRRIEDSIGVPIRRIVFEAERAAAKATIDTMVPKRYAWLVRNALVMHPVSRFFQLLCRLAGLANAHTVFYHVYKGSMASVKNAINLDIMAAMTLGAFESSEGIPYDHQWSEIGGQLYLIIMPAAGKPEIAERMVPEVTRPLRGTRRLEVCSRCGLPKALRHLRWDLPNAIITDTRRDVRMSFVDGYAFSVVFRELIAELGDDIVPIIIEASREYEGRVIEETGFLDDKRGREESYQEYLESLPVWGQGNPVSSEITDSMLVVTIENPFSSHLLAGQLLAVYEAVEGNPGSVEIDEFAPMRVRLTVTPADIALEKGM